MTAETLKVLKQAFGEGALGQSQTYESYNSFTNGRALVDDDKRSDYPLTEITKVAKVRYDIL